MSIIKAGAGSSVAEHAVRHSAPHDASGTEKVEDSSLDGKVIAEYLKGYRTKERVLRPAQVIAGKK
ncbi:MAG: nucleotide exchange factor GrpE [Synergistaceae bacterium]|nr:nucleotide exchange factor GrpE [Synergistaceae bacterium]